MRTNALTAWNYFVESGYIWFLVAVLAWLIIPSVWKDIKHRHSPEFEDRGTLIARRQGTGRSGKNIHEMYFGTFETDSGTVLELEMTRQRYFTLQEGSRGQVHWKGSKLEDFREDET